MFARYKSDPCSRVSRGTEARQIASPRGPRGRGREQANARDGEMPVRGVVAAGLPGQPLLDRGHGVPRRGMAAVVLLPHP